MYLITLEVCVNKPVRVNMASTLMDHGLLS